MAEKCKECGCECAQCMQENDQHHGEMQLHVEIENLRQRLLERDNHIVTMETQFLSEADKFPNGELASIKEEILIWQEKYSRLHEAHKRVQKVNQNLEDKLLRIVDKCETEKGAFTKDIATLSHRLADANYTIHRLTQDNEKYRNDVNLAIQLLQCKPSNFVGQKYDSLPSEVQAKVRTYVAQKRRSSDVSPPDVKSITVPISTFPPTAMVYNVTKPTTTDKHSDDDSDDSKPPVDIVSAAIMAKVLEDRERERIFAKHCDTCTCHKSILLVDAETQTTFTHEPCNECMSKCSHVPNARTNSLKHTDASQNEKQNFLVHSVFQEINENTHNSTKVQHYGNGSCTKHTNCQFGCAKEKVIVRNGRSMEASKEDNRVASNMKSSLSKKASIRRNDAAVQMAPQCRTENANKQSVLQNVTETSINKVSTDKAKQTRANKRPDSQADIKSNSNCWNKFERKASSYNNTTCENSQRYPTVKERSPIDIINDRLWKNEWAKLNSDTYARDNKNKRRTEGDIDIDVINDRAWRNDRTVPEARHPTQLTLIEVKNIDNVNDNDRQLDVATSPSYSSDSIVISTSDPSSSSSDVVHPIAAAQTVHNSSNVKSSSQTKITGPRNCLVRVTPGSKNILLDNAGHYKTVLYTSGGSKPNTALVHVKKGSRSGSERSTSASSDDSSPVLLHDNNQLQRVAEWVQSSVHMDKSEQNNSKIQKSNENASSKRQSASLMFVNETKSKCNPVDTENVHEKSVKDVEEFSGKNARCDVNSLPPSSDLESIMQDKEKDLITFDTPVAEEKHPHNANKINAELDYEVKITKEMEETYLKLAASLDPVALSLTRSDDVDMTIEKYRRDHKKLHVQKLQDRAGSTT